MSLLADRFIRPLLVIVALLLALFVAEPYLARLFFSADAPRNPLPRSELGADEKSTIQLFERVSPSVVHVYAQPGGRALLGPDEENGGTQSGTGFLWDKAGHVVTNNHVVQGAQNIQARLSTGEIVSAEIIGRAPNHDLAVLRLARLRHPPPPVAIGESVSLKVGQQVFAIGNPFGLDQTLTTGIISALRRRLPTGDGRELSDVIQTDAAINPGNSGGPLLDSAGRVIGVNTAIYSPSGVSAGIGFAIPIDSVNRIVPQLIRNGRVPAPGLGIIVASEASSARLGFEGVVILRVLRGSPAERAGLQGVNPVTGEPSDVIVTAGDAPVRRLADLTSALEKAGVGVTLPLSVERFGRRIVLSVQVADMGGRNVGQ
jgi:2-alkenal reductase